MPPRHDPHGETTLTARRSPSRPAWTDDIGKVNQAQDEAAFQEAHRAETKKKAAHIGAHKENIRRNRAAATKKTRQDAQAAAAAQKQAEADAAARSVGGRAASVQRTTGAISSALPSSAPDISDASGLVLALFGWCWIALPMIQGGPSAVRDVWRAKFFNKGPGGTVLL